MEKYLVILIVTLIAYYFMKCFNVKEKFADTPPTDADLQNSIVTLGQIAKDLQSANGIKVPGKLTLSNSNNVSAGLQTDVDNVFRIKNKDGGQMLAIAQDGTSYFGSADKNNANIKCGWLTSEGLTSKSDWQIIGKDNNRFTLHTPDDTRKGLWIVPAKDDAASDWLWGNGINVNRSGETIIGNNATISNNLNVNGSIVAKKPSTDVVNVIYPVEWDMAKWTERMVAFFNKSEPQGTKREFLLMHPGGMSENHPNRWVARMHGVKLGNQVYFFETGPRHENIPNPALNKASDYNWRRDIP